MSLQEPAASNERDRPATTRTAGGSATQPRPVAQHLTCPSCRMTIAPRAHWLAPKHCPRCIAKKNTAIELLPTPPPHR